MKRTHKAHYETSNCQKTMYSVDYQLIIGTKMIPRFWSERQILMGVSVNTG